MFKDCFMKIHILVWSKFDHIFRKLHAHLSLWIGLPGATTHIPCRSTHVLFYHQEIGRLLGEIPTAGLKMEKLQWKSGEFEGMTMAYWNWHFLSTYPIFASFLWASPLLSPGLLLSGTLDAELPLVDVLLNIEPRVDVDSYGYITEMDVSIFFCRAGKNEPEDCSTILVFYTFCVTAPFCHYSGAAHLVRRALPCSWGGRDRWRSWLHPDRWLRSDTGSTGTRRHLQTHNTSLYYFLIIHHWVWGSVWRTMCTCFTELPGVSRCTHADILRSFLVAGASILTHIGRARQEICTNDTIC